MAGPVGPERRQDARVETEGDWLWELDNVVLTTVGVDIGSSTSHLMFSRVRLQRRAHELSSRFVIVEREVLWRSPVLLTPYLPDNSIDAGRLGRFVADAYRSAGLPAGEIDSGAVILTGEALKRRNARALADMFAAEGGKFVCASAGHHLEAVLSAHGSGAVGLSRATGRRVLSVDIGGGTSKLALIDNGYVVGTAALEVGGRLIAHDRRRLVRIEEPIRRVAGWLGLELDLGQELAEETAEPLARAQVNALVAAIEGRWGEDHAGDLLVTEPLELEGRRPEAITFCGGVAEYVYGREERDFDDLALALARGVREAVASGRISVPVEELDGGIRATVIGTSQFSCQVSGNTVDVDDRGLLPVHNLPVVDPRLDLSGPIDAGDVAAAIKAAAGRIAVGERGTAVAVSLRWGGDPEHARLRALARGVAEGMASVVPEGRPLVVVVDADIGRTLGRLLREEDLISAGIISLDGLSLRELDYIDIGQVIQPANVVPVVVKSLLFAPPEALASSSEVRAGSS